MYALTGKYLAGAGYRRYEISNYAKDGFACRHNRVYWRRGDYAGFGLGASSMVQNVRWKNPENHVAYGAYVDNMAGGETGRPDTEQTARLKEAGAKEVQALTVEEQMEEFMFLGLRLTEGVDTREFRRMFGKNMEEIYGKPVAEFEAQGLLERTGNRIRLTPRGIDVSNVIFAAFLF